MQDNISVKDYIRDILDIQAKNYRTLVEMLVNEVKSELKTLRSDVEDIKTSLQFTQKDVDDNNKKILEVEQKISLKSEMLDKAVEGLEDLENRNDYRENQSRRNNIKIYGIPEAPVETWNDCEAKVKKALVDKLGITEEITIERAHRVGHHKKRQQRSMDKGGPGQKNDEPRPIVAKILQWKQKSRIIEQAQKKKPKDVTFREDFSSRVLERRARLIPDLVKARNQGHTAYLVMDRLVIRKTNENVNDNVSVNVPQVPNDVSL